MKKSILFLLAGVAISSCSQEDSIFEQNSNRITDCEYSINSTLATKYGRELYDYEKEELSNTFPNLALEIGNVRVFSEPNANFNCIGYALGTAQWINPPSSIGAFQDLFLHPNNYGYYPLDQFALCEFYADHAVVDGWGTSTKNMTHASKRGSGDDWESKLGANIGITHSRPALISNLYGTIQTSFTFDFLASHMISKEDIDTVIPVLAEKELSLIKNRIEEVNIEQAQRFELLHNAWYKTALNTPEISYSNNMDAWKNAPQFNELVSMGESIIPLIIEKLTHEEYFFTQLVYEAIRKNASKMLMPSYDENGKILIESAQVKAKKYVKNWLEYSI